MADTRMIVLALSPHAAETLKTLLDSDEVLTLSDETLTLLGAIGDELANQLGELAPEKIAALAERMAQAGLDAVAL